MARNDGKLVGFKPDLRALGAGPTTVAIAKLFGQWVVWLSATSRSRGTTPCCPSFTDARSCHGRGPTETNHSLEKAAPAGANTFGKCIKSVIVHAEILPELHRPASELLRNVEVSDWSECMRLGTPFIPFESRVSGK